MYFYFSVKKKTKAVILTLSVAEWGRIFILILNAYNEPVRPTPPQRAGMAGRLGGDPSTRYARSG